MEPKAGDSVCSGTPLQYSCESCGQWGFNFQTCKLCGRAKLCLSCQDDHASRCQPGTRWLEAECEFDQGRILEIEAGTEEAGGLVLDLGSSNTCPKHGHNQHGDFIDVTNFGLDNLPENIRHTAVLDYVLAKAALTVRITTKWTSRSRPDDDPYDKDRGRRGSRMATGVCHTAHLADTFHRQLCEVPNCHRKSDLGEQHSIFSGELYVYTNKHVVFDEEEMRSTSVEFFLRHG